jgi:hypothetical protein
VVDGVIVHERSKVDQLDGSSQRDCLGFGRILNAAAKENERRAEHLAAHSEEVRADLRDERRIVRQSRHHVVTNCVEPIAN